MLAASTRLGPYVIAAPLGAGGMGEVYRARDSRLGREVAVKVLHEHLADDPHRRERFEREARAVAALSHPNILAIHDFGTHDGITFAVMELLEGETLRARLKSGALPWRETVEIGAAVAEGLAAAHARGIVHRDIKPENLFVTADGRVKILDFGLARVTPQPSSHTETGPYVPAETNEGTVMGTVGYMSPEQVRAQPADARSDLFSLGCVLYEMVTGRRAFQRETAAETMTAILHDEPPDPSGSGHHVPGELGGLLRQCLAKTPGRRLQSARDLALALRALTGGTEAPRAASAGRRVPLLLKLGAAAFLLAAAGVAAYYFARSPRPVDPGPTPVAAEQVEAVAILPFENVGGDPAAEFLSDGVAEHLINSLSQVGRRDFKVRPFTSVARYKRQPADVRTVGREMNVQMIVTGRLQQQGDDLSIHVAVVDVGEEAQKWGRTYRGQRGAILDLQDQIARDVAANLRLELTGEEEQRLTKRYTADPELYFLYREGAHYSSKLTVDDVRRGKEYFERALRKDPDYVPALLGVSMSDIVLGSVFLGPRKTHPGAKKVMTRLVALDDSLAQAHAGLAMIHMALEWDWRTAEREAKRAVELGSHLPMYGFWLAAHGRLEESLAVLERGQRLDPGGAPRRNELAMCYNWMRKYDLAVAEANKALELDPRLTLAYVELSLAHAGKGEFDEAVRVLEEGMPLGRTARYVGTVGYVLGLAGRREEAEKLLAELTEAPTRRFGDAFAIARIHTALGDKPRALEWLRKAAEERYTGVLWIKVDPTLDPLRSEPRFAELVKEIGLPP